MITAKYIVDNIGESRTVLYPNEAIDVSYDELSRGKPAINYISLDGMGIDLYDDTSEFVSDGDYCGYISTNVSDENSVSTDSIAVYSSSFKKNDLDVTHGITINFEKDYATEILIAAFDNDDNEVYSNTFTINKLNNFFAIEPFMCNRIFIYFKKTNTPNSFIKINTFALGQIQVIDSFFDFELQDEKDLLSADLPIGQVKFSTICEQNLIGKEGNQLVVFDDGQLLGTYYIKEIKKQSKNKYTFTAQNILYKFDKKTYSDKFAFSDSQWDYAAVNAYDELVKLFEFVGVNYYIDDSLKKVWLNSYMETGKTARYVLQQICFASGAYVDCWMTDKIKILVNKPIYLTKTIKDGANVTLDTQVKEDNLVTSVVWKFNFREIITDESFSPEIIGRFYTNSSGIVTYRFESEAAINDVVGLNVGSFSISESTPTVIVGFADAVDTYVMWGYPIVKKEINKKIFLRNSDKENEIVLNKYNLVGFKTDKILPDVDDENNIKTLDNIKDYYTKLGAKTLTAKIVYNGEKTGDLISIQTDDGSMFTGIITSLVFSNANSYRAAKIEVIEWNI